MANQEHVAAEILGDVRDVRIAEALTATDEAAATLRERHLLALVKSDAEVSGYLEKLATTAESARLALETVALAAQAALVVLESAAATAKATLKREAVLAQTIITDEASEAKSAL